jgi:hypothetical protein
LLKGVTSWQKLRQAADDLMFSKPWTDGAKKMLGVILAAGG